MPKRVFIDAHCHFFNLDDIPIYPTIMGAMPVNTFLLLGLSFRWIAVKALQQFKPFIQFFERSRNGNLKMYSKAFWSCASKENYDEIILTPLVMDFSVMKDSVEHVTDQMGSLVSAIRSANAELMLNNTKVLPFFGIDMRHFDDCQMIDDVIQKISALSGGEFDFEKEKGLEVQSGSVIGFKLV